MELENCDSCGGCCNWHPWLTTAVTAGPDHNAATSLRVEMAGADATVVALRTITRVML
jgi:hypothetical protein